MKQRQTAEKAEFKQLVNTALFSSSTIKQIIVGDMTNMSKAEILAKFKKHVQSALTVEETITDAGTYIFYDVYFPELMENLKTCRMVMYVMSHRDLILDYHNDDYNGNLADVLEQAVEDAILNDEDVVNAFGIGPLKMVSLELYNSQRFYGSIFTFEVSDFRNKYS